MKYRSLLLLTGLAVCLSAAACNDAQPPPTNSGPTPSPDSSPVPSPSASVSRTVDPKRLIDKIKELQREYVRDSTGTEADQCFTADDFTQFKSDRKTAEIVERLQKDSDFKALLNSIKDMNPEQRGDLLDQALNKYRRTWSELHINPKTASAEEVLKGQSKAGSDAEKLIAQTVVDLVRKMI